MFGRDVLTADIARESGSFRLYPHLSAAARIFARSFSDTYPAPDSARDTLLVEHFASAATASRFFLFWGMSVFF